jgi:hypothetical protein
MLIATVSVNIAAGAVYLWYVHALITSGAVGRSVLVGILLLGSAMRLAAVPPAPGLEDDFYRYLWDGAVLSHGVNPYQNSPQQVSLARTGQARVDPRLIELAEDAPDVLGKINHKNLRTIYPPVAEAWFAVAHRIQPWSLNAWRSVILLHDLATVALLLAMLKELGLPLVLVAVYWLNPLVVKEFYQGVHMDVLALPWVLGAMWATTRSRTVLSMAILVGAASVKLWPLMLVPVLLRPALHKPRKLLLGGAVFVAVWAAMMSPMFFCEGAPQSGLTRYAEAWQNNAGFFALHHRFWEWALPRLGSEAWRSQLVTRWVTVGLVVLWVGVLIVRPIRDGSDLCRRSLWAVAGPYLVSPTQFPWYYTWLVPLLAVRTAWPLLLYTALLPLYYVQYTHPWVLWLEHGPVWLMLILVALRFSLRSKRSEPGSVGTTVTEDVGTMRTVTQ